MSAQHTEARAAVARSIVRGVLDATKPERTFEQRLRESGAIAFRHGLRRVDCVCAPGSAARRWWQLGYDAAKRAAKATGSAA